MQGHHAGDAALAASESSGAHSASLLLYQQQLLHTSTASLGAHADVAVLLGLGAPDRVSFECGGGVEFVLPQLFGIVESGVFRSGYPTPETFPFLRRLRLRAAVNLLDNLPEAYEDFLRAEGVHYVHSAVKGNKASCDEMDRGRVAAAIAMIMDRRNHPILVHCRSGKHRTGALVGCVRMLQRWSLEEACDEYVYFCKHKQRYVDKQYIERFDPRTLAPLVPPPEHLAPFLGPPTSEGVRACISHRSALDDAIASGALSAADAEDGIPVSAMVNPSYPEEPGVPVHLPSGQRLAAAAVAAPSVAPTPPFESAPAPAPASVEVNNEKAAAALASAGAAALLAPSSVPSLGLSTSALAALSAALEARFSDSALALPELEPGCLRISTTTVSGVGLVSSSHESVRPAEGVGAFDGLLAALWRRQQVGAAAGRYVGGSSLHKESVAGLSIVPRHDGATIFTRPHAECRWRRCRLRSVPLPPPTGTTPGASSTTIGCASCEAKASASSSEPRVRASGCIPERGPKAAECCMGARVPGFCTRGALVRAAELSQPAPLPPAAHSAALASAAASSSSLSSAATVADARAPMPMPASAAPSSSPCPCC